MKGWVQKLFDSSLYSHIMFSDLLECSCFYFTIHVAYRPLPKRDGRISELSPRKLDPDMLPSLKPSEWGVKITQSYFVIEGAGKTKTKYQSSFEVCSCSALSFPLKQKNSGLHQDNDEKKNIEKEDENKDVGSADKYDELGPPTWNFYLPLSRIKRELPLTFHLEKNRETIGCYTLRSFSYLRNVRPNDCFQIVPITESGIQHQWAAHSGGQRRSMQQSKLATAMEVGWSERPQFDIHVTQCGVVSDPRAHCSKVLENDPQDASMDDVVFEPSFVRGSMEATPRHKPVPLLRAAPQTDLIEIVGSIDG